MDKSMFPTYHLDEFGILHHHRVDNPQEALVRREYTHAASESVSLQKALTHMLAEDFDDPTATSVRELIPLKVAVGVVKHGVELVAL